MSAQASGVAAGPAFDDESSLPPQAASRVAAVIAGNVHNRLGVAELALVFMGVLLPFIIIAQAA